ncbi:molybdopterin-dependent oxidoreductase [candidate division KSB1 bacterium]
MKTFLTACPRNCYSTCSMTVYVDNGKIKNIEGHPQNKATSQGVCLKGLSYIERVYSPERILCPLIKNNKTGEFEDISWDSVLDIMSEKLQYFKKEYGPQSVLFYSASGTKGLLNSVSSNFWRLYGGYTTTYGDLCWQSGLEATRLTLGENKNSAPWDIEKAKLIIIWGKNPAETNIHQMSFIDNALENGAKLIIIDPRRTPSSERAELLIQPRPGTDGALALGIANQLIKNNYADREFISKHVKGYEEFSKNIEEFTPDKVSEITDIPENYIKRLTEYIGTIKPMTISAGFGMQRYTNSGQTMRSILALNAITGNIGKSGSGWLYANLQSHIFDDIKDPVASYPPATGDGIIRKSISVAKLGSGIIEQKDPPVKMIWVERANPVTTNPETPKTLEALRSLELRVVVDQFLTDTAREADIILPAKTMFEQTDIINAYWHTYIQLKQKILDPPGSVKPETEIYHHLAKRLGFSKEDIDRYIPAPSEDDIQNYLERFLKPFPELSLEKLKEGPVLSPYHVETAWSDLKFSTPSGKIELLSEQASELWETNVLPDFKESEESTVSNKELSDKYPLYFLTPNTKNRIHSQFNNLQMIKNVSEKPYISINPKDAENRNIENGDLIEIFNDRGRLKINSKIDHGIKAGCVAVTNGWWITENGTVNYLSKERETDMGYGAAFHDNLVEIKKI